MIFLGTVVNVLAIVAGSLGGLFLGRFISGKTRQAIMHVLGLAVLLIGLKMALSVENILNVTASLVLGTWIGERMNIERMLNGMIESILRRITHKEGNGRISQAFITASLLFVVGSMSILGSIESGLTGDHHLLYMKSFLDGTTSIFFASTLGIGVLFSAVPVLFFQGSLTLIAYMLAQHMHPEFLDRFTQAMNGTGGILILAIGLNLMDLTQLRIANMLPALLVAWLLTWIF